MSSGFFVPLFAVTGLVLGSFANVLIVRYGTTQWVSGRSKCPRCKKVLRWYDLFPIASFVMLGGKCRHCGKAISAQYPLVELASAAIFLLTFSRMPDVPLLAALSGLILYMLLVTSIVDAKHRQIPDVFTAVIAIAAVTSVALYGSWQDALFGMVVGVAWFGWQWLVSGGKWVGSGDILLAGALGLWLGFGPTVAMLVAAYGLGALVAGGLLISGKVRLKKTKLAFAPFIAAGTLCSFLGAAQWYLSLLR